MPGGRPRTRPLPGEGPISTQGAKAPEAPLTPMAAPVAAAPAEGVENKIQAEADNLVNIVDRREDADVERFVAQAEAARPELQDPNAWLVEQNEIRRQIEERRARRIAGEAQLRREHQIAVAEARENKQPLPPIRTSLRSVGVDSSLPVDRDGTPAGTPGLHKRWVSMRDAAGQQNSQRANDMMQWGYQIVRSKVDGKPLTNLGCILMECPPDVEADRVADAQRDLVSARDAENEKLAVVQENARRRFRNEAGKRLTADPVEFYTPMGGEWGNSKTTHNVGVEEEMALQGLNL